MKWSMALSVVCIVAGGCLVCYVLVDAFDAIYNLPETGEDVDPEVFIENAERALKIVPLVNGGGLLFLGLALGAHALLKSRRPAAESGDEIPPFEL